MIETNSLARRDAALAIAADLLPAVEVVRETRQPVARARAQARADEVVETMLRVLGGPGDDEGDEDDEYEDVWGDDEDDLRFDDGPDSENDDPEVQAALDAFRAAHEEGWIDSPLPVLGGRTPREAAADDALRPDLVTLLAEMDGPGGGFDTDRARQRLGLTG